MFRQSQYPDRDRMDAAPRESACSPWAIVLAGGNGSRMSAPIKRWLGEDRPKQYCAFVGSRTLLQHTVDRISALVPPERILVVIGKNQRAYFEEAVAPDSVGTVIEQPSNRGTMPAIFAAAAHVLHHDSNATLLVTPSDHFVGSENRYIECLKHGLRLAEYNSEVAFLMGANADRAETDYGWIVPGEKMSLWDRQCPHPVPLTIKRFREKPSPMEAENLLQTGCLWNMFSMTMKAMTLWMIGWRVLPNAMRRFEGYLKMLSIIREGNLDASHRAMALERLYENLDVVDFSKDILEKAHPWCSVLPADQLEWSDWGAPERLKETLLRRNKPSAIPLEYLESRTVESEKRAPQGAGGFWRSPEKPFPFGTEGGGRASRML